MEEWLASGNPNLRRAVSEGLRIWTARPYFNEHPEIAVRMLAALRNDESDYVRRSAGNALRDISRAHPALVRSELATWDVAGKREAQVHKLAARFLTEAG
jgi:3-methyladenine DNA glycosylase AlkC